MVNILGIFAILYVYYCEIDAVPQKLEFWNPTTEYADTRRAHSANKTLVSVNKTIGILRLRSSEDHPHAKSLGFRAEIKAVIHHPRHGKPHVEPILRHSEDRNSDVEHPVDKINRHKTRNGKKRNKDDKKNHNTDKDQEDNTNRNPNMNKHHDTQKKHSKDKKHNKDRIHSIESDQYQKNNNIKDKIHNKDKLSIARDTNQENNDSKDKTLKKEKIQSNEDIMDSKQSKDNSHESINVHADKKQQPKDNSKNRNKNKEKSEKDRGIDANRIEGPIRISTLHPEPVQGRILEHMNKWPGRHHRSKLRTHKETDDAHLRSTRMIPLSLMQQEQEGEPKKNGSGGSPPMTLSPYALMTQMKEMMDFFSDANATFETLGHTVEYNDIVIVKITQKKNEMGKYFRAEESKYMDEVPEKKIIFIVHGLSVMGMRQLTPLVDHEHLRLLMSYYLKHLDKFDIFLIPMANPDGYLISHTPSHSMWNKNVSPQDACPGVSLDRNFDVAWNGTRKISSCSQLYPGPSPFSEIESRAVRDVFHYFGHKILAYIHVHSGTFSNKVFKGDAILYPRGYTEVQSDDDKYIDLRGEIDEAMKNASFQVLSLTVETLYNWYGKVSGTSVDYASSVYGIPYALEFVMQLYEGGEHHSYNYYSLTEIWSRMIDTTFNNMWKSLHVNEVRRK